MELKTYNLDRFIPPRGLIDFDRAYEKITIHREMEIENEENSLMKCTNHKRLELQKQLDKITRINERLFKISPFSTQTRKLYPTMDRLWPCQPRLKPTIQDEKILDLPEFNCGFHLNPIDWGSNNYLATSVGNKVLIGGNLDRVKVKKETIFEHDNDRSTAVSWSPDGKNLAFGSESGYIVVWHILKRSLTFEDVCCFGSHCTITVIQWHPTSAIVAWGCSKGRLSVRSINNVPIADEEKAHRGYICSLRYSPSGDYLCSSGKDGFLRIWKGYNYDPYMEIEMPNPSRAIAWHPWRTGLLAVGEGPPAPGSLSLWNVNTAKLLFTKKLPPKASITALQFNSITGELVFSQRVEDNYVGYSEIFVLGGPQLVTDSITNLRGTIFALMWNADNTKLGAASSDETFRIWNFIKPVRNKRRFNDIEDDLNFLALKRFKSIIR